MPARRSPYFNMVEVGDDGVVRLAKPASPPFVRRQDAPACYDMNASIYAWTRDALMSDRGLLTPDTRLHVMPEERSIDIDSELDFRFVEFLLVERNAMEARR
jgi:N-acylneuraminate cytidylyltransferase/CMP-N,N'-diacetyllegionaminic acid synthase